MKENERKIIRRNSPSLSHRTVDHTVLNMHCTSDGIDMTSDIRPTDTLTQYVVVYYSAHSTVSFPTLNHDFSRPRFRTFFGLPSVVGTQYGNKFLSLQRQWNPFSIFRFFLLRRRMLQSQREEGRWGFYGKFTCHYSRT